ncbi:MAG: S8 family serine peptidase [Pseudomonadota bacterium]
MQIRQVFSTVTAVVVKGLLVSSLALLVADCADPNVISHHRKTVDPAINTTHILVRFANNTSNSARARVLSAAGVPSSNGVSLVPGLTLAAVPPGQTVAQAINTLSQSTSVLYVEPDYVLSANVLVNDTRFSLQWGLHNTAQSGGKVDADIDAPEAWDLQTGAANTVIAVIDTGVDYNHPDLTANIWSNTGEIPGNGVDDDGNGYIDDVRGWNFADNTNNPIDLNNHGTHVAGIIAASGNNATGVTGVNWLAKIMPLRFMDANGSGTTSNAIRALEYAVRNGARISNNSWGGPSPSRALSDAIIAANNAGHLFVTAAGNVAGDIDATPEYPASFNIPNIVTVASTDQSDNLSSFSNFGAVSVDLAAPGSQIHSTLRNNRYGSFSGTSMAAPFVAGVAGLVLSQNAGLTVAQIKSALLNNVDPLPGLQGKMVSGGRLNAFKAVSAVAAAQPAISANPVATTPLALNVSSVQLVVGDIATLSASGGAPPYTWASSDSTVLAITSAGQVTAVTAGTATVSVVDSGGRQLTISAVVSPLPPRNIQVAAAANIINVGQTVQLSAVGGVAPYVWLVSNPVIASINVNGLLTALGVGGIVVSATDKDGFTGSSSVLTLLQVAAPAPPPLPAPTPAPTPSPAPAPSPMPMPMPVTMSSNIVSTFNTLQVTVAGGKAPYTWSLSSASGGTVFPDQLNPSVAWYTAGSVANISVSVVVTDSSGTRGESASVSIVNALK